MQKWLYVLLPDFVPHPSCTSCSVIFLNTFSGLFDVDVESLIHLCAGIVYRDAALLEAPSRHILLDWAIVISYHVLGRS